MKKFTLFLYFFLLSIFIFLSSGVIDSQDGFQYLAVARNIYYTGKPTAPADDYSGKFQNIHMSTYKGKDGNTYGPTGIGYSLAYLPAVVLTNIFYKIYQISPYMYFPLEADWLIFLTASFTNGFFAAGLGVILFLYFLEIGLSKKQALLLMIAGIFATNLLVYAKHSMAHMMFTMFLVLSFYFLKLYSRVRKKHLLIFSGASFGAVMNTYNPTFLLPIIPFVLYYLFLMNPKFKVSFLKIWFKDSLFIILGLLPFIAFYLWMDNIRALDPSYNQANYFSNYAGRVLEHFPITAIFEGIYGQLLSPGRSILLYSPILLVLIIFWYKIKRQIRAEVIAFLILAAIYIIFYAMQNIYTINEGIIALWHGESSWGPRYLVPLLPFGLLIVGFIYKNLSRTQKLFVFLPLIILGFLIQMVGIIVPYQDKFHNTEKHFYVNQTEYTNYSYVNLLPRYSPLITMPKELIKMIKIFPKTLDHGIYNTRLYDGIDFPFDVGPERWRVIKGVGHISFDNNPKNPVNKFTFGIINHPISGASHSAVLKFSLNGLPIENTQFVLKPEERRVIEVPVKNELLKENNNQLNLEVSFDNPIVLKESTQILGLISFSINDSPVNLESFDFPYLSQLGPKMTGVFYQNFGGTNIDPWLSWEIHTQIYERVPDFWWIKFLYYWDVPRKQLFALLLLNFVIMIYFGIRVLTSLKKLKP